MISSPSAAGIEARRRVMCSGVSTIWAASSACGARPANGGWPTSISYAITPHAYTSARASTCGSALTCSGAMYAGVPSVTPMEVSPVAPAGPDSLIALATPKSVTMAAPLDSSTLSGLMSRCTTPCACE